MPNVIATNCPYDGRVYGGPGCEDLPAVESAFWRMMWAPGNLDWADVVTMRRCGEKAMESMRSEANMIVDVADSSKSTSFSTVSSTSISPPSSPTMTPKPTPRPQRLIPDIFDWALEESLINDRDLVLAHSLQRSPGIPAHAKRIVGVVGARHVSGVTRLWEQIPTAASRQQYNAALLTRPADCPIEDTKDWKQNAYIAAGSMATLALGGSHPAVRRSTAGRVLRRGVGVAAGLTVAAGSAATLATAWVVGRLGQVATGLDMAASRAEEEGLAPPYRRELRSRHRCPLGGSPVVTQIGIGNYEAGCDQVKGSPDPVPK